MLNRYHFQQRINSYLFRLNSRSTTTKDTNDGRKTVRQASRG